MKQFLFASFMALSLVATPAYAQATLEELADMPSGTYHLDKSHATVLFKVRHMGFADYIGRFNDFAGHINFNKQDPTQSSAHITIQTASVDTNNTHLEEKLTAEDVFNVAAFPEIAFNTTELSMKTPTNGQMVGNLTMLGKTFPVTFDVTFHGGGIHPFSKQYTMGFSANTTIDRTQWGLESWVPMVGATVDIEVHAEFGQMGETGADAQ